MQVTADPKFLIMPVIIVQSFSPLFNININISINTSTAYVLGMCMATCTSMWCLEPAKQV